MIAWVQSPCPMSWPSLLPQLSLGRKRGDSKLKDIHFYLGKGVCDMGALEKQRATSPPFVETHACHKESPGRCLKGLSLDQCAD